jgi:hypothetical protein
MTSSPLPPPPYKRRQEPHNPLPHPFPTLFWVSLTQELAFVGAHVIVTAATPHRPAASVTPLPWVMADELLREPLFLHKHPQWAIVHHNRHALKLRRVLAIVDPPWIKHQSQAKYLHPVHAIFHMIFLQIIEKILEFYTNTPLFLRIFVPIPNSE